jgi:hypothetical protein
MTVGNLGLKDHEENLMIVTFMQTLTDGFTGAQFLRDAERYRSHLHNRRQPGACSPA